MEEEVEYDYGEEEESKEGEESKEELAKDKPTQKQRSKLISLRRVLL